MSPFRRSFAHPARRLAVGLMAGCLFLGAQTPPREGIARPAVRVFAEGSGLQNLAVVDLVQGPDGEVWAGTQKGVARHAGARFQPLEGPGDPAPAMVVGLLATRKGLWVGTAMDGLLFRDAAGWRRWTSALGQPLRRIRQVVEDGQGVVHLILSGGQVLRMEGETLVPAPGMPPVQVYGLQWTPDGWLAVTPQGLWQQRGGTWSQAPEIRGLAFETCAFGGETVVAAQDGLHQGTPGHWRPLPLKSEGPIISIAAGPGLEGGEALWACTARRLYCLEKDRVTRVQLTPQGDASLLTKVRVTQAGNRRQVWVASMEGLFRLQPGGWTPLEPGAGPGNSITYGLVLHPDGSTWFGDVTGRIHRLAGGTWRSWSPAPAGSRSQVVALCPLPGPGGRILASTLGSGLWSWDGREWKARDQGLLAPGTYLPALGPGHHGKEEGVWVAGEPGLHFLSPTRGLQLVANPHQLIRWLLVAPGAAERVLAGGSMDEILAWDGTAFRPWASLPGLRFSAVAAWVPGEEGRTLRLGTFSKGILTLDASGRVVSEWNRSRVPGWPGDSILSLTHDAGGRAWVGTDGGIAVMTPGGRLLATYTSQDGLPSNLCTNTALAAGPRDIWVCTSKGGARLAAPSWDPAPARALAVKALATDRGPFAPGATLDHRVRNLRFTCELPLFHREDDARYAFTLEGLDTQQGPWVREPRMVYPTLPPGRYVLRVRAVDPDGREAVPVAIPFRIAPPIWRHPALLALYVLAATLGATVLHRARTARLRARAEALSAAVDKATGELRAANERLYHLNDEKNRIIGVAAHDLRNPLSSILLYCDLLQESLPPGQTADLDRIRGLGKSMADLLQGLLDVHAIEKDTAEAPTLEAVLPQGVLMDLQRTHLHRASRKGIELTTECLGAPGLVLADPRQLQRVLDNLLSNAVKYAPAGSRVVVRLREEPGGVRFEVVDEGPGLTPEDLAKVFGAYARLSAKPTGGEASVGLGLSIARKLVEGMGGTIGVESVHGHGATFWIRLPAAQAKDSNPDSYA